MVDDADPPFGWIASFAIAAAAIAGWTTPLAALVVVDETVPAFDAAGWGDFLIGGAVLTAIPCWLSAIPVQAAVLGYRRRVKSKLPPLLWATGAAFGASAVLAAISQPVLAVLIAVAG